MPDLSRRAVSLAVLAGSLALLLVAVGCRSGEVSQASNEGGGSALVSDVPVPEPSGTILSNTVTAATALPVLVSDADEPVSPSDTVAVTAAPEEPRSDPQGLPLCSELEFEEGAAAGLAQPSLRRQDDLPMIEFAGRSISAMHAPDPAWAVSALYAVVDAERADPRAYETQYLFVTVTSESGAERTHRLPLAPPWEVHPSLRTAASAGWIVATDEGWMIPVNVTTFMDSRVLVSQYFAEHAPGVGTAERHFDSERQVSGLRISLADYYPARCFASWAELDTSEDLYDRYGAYVVYIKPYQDVGQESGYLWVSRWDGEPVQAELPDQWGRCCIIQVLDEGYLADSSTVQAGSHVWPFNGPLLHYSRDGIEWRKVEIPTRKFTFDDQYTDSADIEWIDIPIWVCSVESIDSGVLIAEGQGDSHHGTMCDTVRHWVADADLTNWRLHPDAANTDS